MTARKVLGPRSSTNYPPPVVSDVKEVRSGRRYEIEKTELEKSYPILDRLQEGVIVCDFGGTFHFANLSAQDTLGYSMDELSAMNFREISAKGQAGELAKAIEEVRTMSVTSDITRFKVLSKYGSTRILAGRASLVTDLGVGFGAIAFIRDVTEFFRMQEELTEARTFRAIGDASSRAAHDIRNLILPARIVLDSLSSGDLAASGESDLKVLQVQAKTALEAIDRVTYLTGEMMQLAVPGPQKMDPLNVNKLMFDVLMRVKSAMPDQFARISGPKTSFSTGLPQVLGDKVQLERAVSNIMVNAIEAMPSGGLLSISTDFTEEGRVRISISDTGMGMEQDVLDSIFVPFYTTKGERGNGLGLVISARIIKSHSGYITVESEAGKGTTFEIHFPPVEK